MLKAIALVGIGGGVGSIFRFLISYYTLKTPANGFPFATFLVNITGCLLIGFFFGFFESGSSLTTNLRLILITGFCGGYTTFSAFSLESFTLFQQGLYATAISYIISSVVFGFVAVYLGFMLSKV